ncbi:ArsR/SmtB family transcription factor [Profundibacter sp.]
MNTAVKETGIAEQNGADLRGASLAPHAFKASSLLKALGHEGRLMILCHLNNGEKTVTELQALLSAPQALVSSQLARLRHEGMVTFRKEGQTSYYSLSDKKARQVLNLVNKIFCGGLTGRE